MSKKLQILLLTFLLSSCIETVAVTTFGTGYLLTRNKSIKATVSDSAILAGITKALLSNNKEGKFEKINVSVYEGRVLLVGYSQTRENIQEAIRLIWGVDNVKEVINEVSTESDEKRQKQFIDFLLLVQIKTHVILADNLKAKDLNLSIYNGKVYILGNAQNEEAIQEIARSASTIKGVKKVISHIQS